MSCSSTKQKSLISSENTEKEIFDKEEKPCLPSPIQQSTGELHRCIYNLIARAHNFLKIKFIEKYSMYWFIMQMKKLLP